MDLEQVTAEIRPRSHWEAADLGCAMVRKNYGTLILHWCLTVLPLQIVIFILLRDYPLWAWTLVWFLKPLYDRVPLFFLSRSLFGEKPNTKDLFRELPKLWTRRIIWALTLGRLSPSRSFTLPVSELEGLRGKAYSQRVRLLARHGDGVALKILLACVHLEFLLGISMASLIYGMVPETMRPNAEGWLQDLMVLETSFSATYYIIAAVLYLLSMMLMEIFYVGAGFGLYVNSRTITEGWDIELAFKRIRERVQGSSGSIIAVIVGFFVFLSPPLKACDYYVDGVIEKVLESEDFEVKTKIVKVAMESDSDPSKPSENGWFSRFLEWLFGPSSSSSSSSGGPGALSFVDVLGNALFWFAIVAAVSYLGFLIYKNRHIFMSQGADYSDVKEETKTRTVVGLDVTPESLPQDLVTTAREAWNSGDHHLALSLLYRGAISRLVQNEGIEIEESDTEYDCVRRVKEHAELRKSSYFHQLTMGWVQLAYGKRAPNDAEMGNLLEAWPFQATKDRGGAQ